MRKPVTDLPVLQSQWLDMNNGTAEGAPSAFQVHLMASLPAELLSWDGGLGGNELLGPMMTMMTRDTFLDNVAHSSSPGFWGLTADGVAPPAAVYGSLWSGR